MFYQYNHVVLDDVKIYVMLGCKLRKYLVLVV